MHKRFQFEPDLFSALGAYQLCAAADEIVKACLADGMAASKHARAVIAFVVWINANAATGVYLRHICMKYVIKICTLLPSFSLAGGGAAAAGCTAWSSSKSTTVPGAFATPRGGGSLPHSQKWSHSVVVGVQSCQLTNTPQPDDDEIEWQGAATGPALFSVPFCSIIPV